MKKIFLMNVLLVSCISSYAQSAKKNVKEQTQVAQPTVLAALPNPSDVLIDPANPANNTGGQLLIPIQVKPTSDGQEKKSNPVTKDQQQNRTDKVAPKK